MKTVELKPGEVCIGEEGTIKFLTKCKEVGYKQVTIGVADKRLPLSMEMKKKLSPVTWGDGKNGRPRIVCALPKLRGKIQSLQAGDTWPLVWQIVRDCGLTTAMYLGGFGDSDSHNIYPTHSLVLGYYDLAGDIEKQVKNMDGYNSTNA